MFDTVFGLPAHALVIHAVVVLVPVAALASVAVALRPHRWRRMWWPALTLDALALLGAWVARLSGEQLVHRLFPSAADRPAQVSTHVHRGADLPWYALGLLVVTLLLVLLARDHAPGAFRRRRVPRYVLPVVAVLTVATAIAVVVDVVLVGHSGSAAVWQGVS